MKILQIGKFYPPDFGGIETVTKLLAEGLNQAGVRCDVLCANSLRQTVVDDCGGYKVFRVKAYGTKFSVPISPGLILWLWRFNKNYNIIHVHLPNPLAELALFIVRPKSRVVLHWHGDVDVNKFGMLAKIQAPLTRWVIRYSSRVIGATRAHIECSSERDNMLSKSAVIPYPFESPDISNTALPVELDKKIYRNKFLVLAVGRLIYYKGLKYLIQAAKYLPKDCLILIVGTGPLDVELRAQIESEEVSDQVTLCGKLPTLNLNTLFSICDVFCLPSTDRGEMFGMVQLEAMSHGKPVVCTRIPNSGVCEVNLNQVTGLTVPVADSIAIAEAIMELKNDQSMRLLMGDAGRELVKKKYEKSVVIPQFIRIYEGLN